MLYELPIQYYKTGIESYDYTNIGEYIILDNQRMFIRENLKWRINQ